MNKYLTTKILLIGAILVFLSSCTSIDSTMRETNARVEFQKSDFTLSDQVTGESTVHRILLFDFERMFTKKKGDINIIGKRVNGWAERYALYDLMSKNPGYDVIFYPSFEITRTSYLLYTVCHVKVTARLGKLN